MDKKDQKEKATPSERQSSHSKPTEPQITSEGSRPSGRKRPRRALVDAAVERLVIKVEEDSAGLRREYPLVDAATLPTKNEKTESAELAAKNDKPESAESVSDSEDGLVDVPDSIEEPDPEQELLRAAGLG